MYNGFIDTHAFPLLRIQYMYKYTTQKQNDKLLTCRTEGLIEYGELLDATYRAENCTVVYQYTQECLKREVVSLERMEQRIQKEDQNVKKSLDMVC